MAKHGTWTVVFEDKAIIKKTEDFSASNPMLQYIDDDTFWGQSKFNGIHAIQFTNDGTDNDQVETSTGNIAYDSSTLGSFQQFVDKFDAAYLSHLQTEWDNNDLGDSDETEAEKITRLGARPTSYTSTAIS